MIVGRDWRIGVEDFAFLFCFSLTGRPSAAGSGARGCHDRGGGGFLASFMFVVVDNTFLFLTKYVRGRL